MVDGWLRGPGDDRAVGPGLGGQAPTMVVVVAMAARGRGRRWCRERARVSLEQT